MTTGMATPRRNSGELLLLRQRSTSGWLSYRSYSAYLVIQSRSWQMPGITLVTRFAFCWRGCARPFQTAATHRYTYGFRSASILASFLNAVILFIVTGAIVVEAIRRFFEPAPVQGTTVIVVAAFAIVLNAVAARVLMTGKSDLNIRGAFLHLVADAAISFGVVVAGAVILLTGWNWIDPVVGILISAVIVWGTWGLLRDSVNLSLDAVPSGISPSEVRSHLEALPGVARIHDLHIWAMSTTETALTCHLVMPGGYPGDSFVVETCHQLHHRFGIDHPTLQVELGEHVCALEPEHVV